MSFLKSLLGFGRRVALTTAGAPKYECYEGPLAGKWVHKMADPKAFTGGTYRLLEDYYSDRLYYVWEPAGTKLHTRMGSYEAARDDDN